MAWSINIIAPNVGVFFCLRVRSSSCALTSIFLSFSSSVIYSFLNSSYHLQDQLSSLLLEACRPDPRSQVLSARSSVSAQQDQGSGANCYQTYFTARWSDQQAFIRCDQFTYRKFLRHFYSTATYWSQDTRLRPACFILIARATGLTGYHLLVSRDQQRFTIHEPTRICWRCIHTTDPRSNSRVWFLIGRIRLRCYPRPLDQGSVLIPDLCKVVYTSSIATRTDQGSVLVVIR